MLFQVLGHSRAKIVSNPCLWLWSGERKKVYKRKHRNASYTRLSLNELILSVLATEIFLPVGPQ